MKQFWGSLAIALSATLFMNYQSGAFAEKPDAANSKVAVAARAEDKKSESSSDTITAQIDKTSLNNGGTITVTGTAPAGKPVLVEIWSEKTVRSSRFDSDPDKETGIRPYIFYLTEELPAYYKIFLPAESREALESIKKEGKSWSFSKALKDLGAELAYSAPANIKTERYQTTLTGSIIGSRGELLPAMDEKENKKRSMQLVKARFRNVDKVMGSGVVVNPDGSYKAEIKIREGLVPGKYSVVAYVDKKIKSQAQVFENNINFPMLYLENAGTSLNLFGPLLLALVVTIFGVLMGAGGGFILNPLLLTIWPLPHTVVAGTVMPTVLFAQGSGIYNYSRIKFISWKLGIAIGVAMVLGGFIGPKLTELITLDQFKFFFGWILLILAGLMVWQTTPGYLAKNKKEQAILKEFQKRAAEDVAKRKHA
jgi:uncharacterized protein